MFDIKLTLTKSQIENILKALSCAEENNVLCYGVVGELWDYIMDEMQKQIEEKSKCAEA